MLSLWRNLQPLIAVVAMICVRFFGLRSVSICSATANSKCQEFSLKIQEKDLRINSLIKRNYTWQFECTVNLRMQWIREETSYSWTQNVKMWNIARPKKKTWILVLTGSSLSHHHAHEMLEQAMGIPTSRQCWMTAQLTCLLLWKTDLGLLLYSILSSSEVAV